LRDELVLKNVLGAVPTGVDVAHFSAVKPARKPRSLVFLGSMDWMPNIDSVHFFVAEIFPLLKAKFPETKFTIVGRNPPQSVRDLAARDANICVTGTVDDVRPFVAESEVMIVPLRIGGGTRIKIYEGMASAIPVVSTRIGAEGLPVSHGEQILLADSPEDFAREIGRLFEQPQLRECIGQNGFEFVRDNFGWESVTKIFEDYCIQICSK
jgi:glycosyltransferase involved in cell wall biosynthesis